MTSFGDTMGFAIRFVTITVCCVLASTSAAAQRASITNAAWLAGCWERSAKDRVVQEQWMSPRGSVMLGMSRTVVRDTTREFEQLRIDARQSQTVYVAHPSDQAEASFAAVVLSDTLLLFRNAQHDFPQDISYRRVTNDSIVARIEGKQGGKVRGINFPMARVRCDGVG